jgi:hypothetical protein
MLFAFDKRDKADRTQRDLLEMVVMPRDHQQFLAACGTDRHDQPAAGCQLLEQFFGQFGCRGRYEDAIVRRVFGPPFPAVAWPELHVVDIELAQSLPRLSLQLRDALDRINLLDQRREYRGLVAAAGPDLQYLLAVETLDERLATT